MRLFHGVRVPVAPCQVLPTGCLALCSRCFLLSSQTPTSGYSQNSLSLNATIVQQDPQRPTPGPSIFLFDCPLRPISEPLLPGCPVGLDPAYMRLAHPPFHALVGCRGRAWSLLDHFYLRVFSCNGWECTPVQSWGVEALRGVSKERGPGT